MRASPSATRASATVVSEPVTTIRGCDEANAAARESAIAGAVSTSADDLARIGMRISVARARGLAGGARYQCAASGSRVAVKLATSLSCNMPITKAAR